MDSKRWYASKTLWVNAIALAGMIVQGITGQDFVDTDVQAGGLAFVNLILRAITSKGLTS